MNTFIHYWPNASLLIWLLVVFTLDFIFGICRATLNGIPRTSRGLRRSVIKLLQYGGCIIVAVVILNIVYDARQDFGRQFAGLFGDLMVNVMIYTEIISVFENMEAMAPHSAFVRYFVRPARRILTFQLKHVFREMEKSTPKKLPRPTKHS